MSGGYQITTDGHICHWWETGWRDEIEHEETFKDGLQNKHFDCKQDFEHAVRDILKAGYRVDVVARTFSKLPRVTAVEIHEYHVSNPKRCPLCDGGFSETAIQTQCGACITFTCPTCHSIFIEFTFDGCRVFLRDHSENRDDQTDANACKRWVDDREIWFDSFMVALIDIFYQENPNMSCIDAQSYWIERLSGVCRRHREHWTRYCEDHWYAHHRDVKRPMRSRANDY